MENKKISEVITEDISWKDITPAGNVFGGGTSAEFNTGEWRVDKPIFIEDKCKQCLLCIPVCPDSAIPVENKKRSEFNYMHCKGCGICAKVCPFDAIEMVKEEV